MKEGWEIKKLGEVCRFINGRAYSQHELLKEGKYPVLRVGNFYTNRDWYYSDLELPEDKYCDKGDLLYAWSASFGPRIWDGEKVIYHYHIWKVEPNDKLIRKDFLFQLLEWDTEAIKTAHGTGTTMMHVGKGSIENRQIPLPPLPEQQRIVAILDKAFAAITNAKANAEQNLKNAKELFDSYLQGVFENGNWETKTLNEISENLDSKRVPITKNVRNEGSIPYYGASGIVDYVADYLFDEDLLCVSEDGANLLARTYQIAFSISGKTWVNNHAHVLRFKNMVSQKFVEQYLNSIKLDEFVSGMAQPKLNQTMLNKIPIPFPSLKEQGNIVSKLDALSSETKKLQGIYQTKINDLEELKKAILQKAFAGELSMETAIAQTAVAKKLVPNANVPTISPTDLQAGIVAIALQRHQQQNKTNTFHHVKTEKIVHLAQATLALELGRVAWKDAAGPNDFPHAKKVESRAQKAGFYTVHKKGNYYEYAAGTQMQKIIDKTYLALADKAEKLNSLIDLMVPMNTQQAEIFATVYAGWNNLLLDKKEFTDEDIVTESRENWHKDKLAIDRNKFFAAIKWMRDINVVPTGTGAKVSKKSSAKK
jgi:type I restriction enzyme, S subunit